MKDTCGFFFFDNRAKAPEIEPCPSPKDGSGVNVKVDNGNTSPGGSNQLEVILEGEGRQANDDHGYNESDNIEETRFAREGIASQDSSIRPDVKAHDLESLKTGKKDIALEVDTGSKFQYRDITEPDAVRTPKTADETSGKPPHEVVLDKELHKELDFDINPSELYLLLQRRDWIGATQRVKKFPEEATYWISRKELDGKLRWRLLPLHGAIIFSAPDTMIQTLVDAYPASVSSKDDQGMLPLHLSYRMGSAASVVEVLLNAFPESVDVKDRKGRTPVHMAQTSKGPNRSEFLRAVEKKASTPKPSVSAVSSEAREARKAEIAGQRAIFEAQIKELKRQHKEEIEKIKIEFQRNSAEIEKQAGKFKAELKLTEETSSVLVEHVASLEKKLKTAEETETALATRIATLDNSYKATLREKQALEVLSSNERDRTKRKTEELEALLVTAHQDYKKLKDKVIVTRALGDKDRKELEEKLKGRTKEYEALKVDYEGICNNVTILEGQLRNKILHEQKLVKQVSSLARQLSQATEDNDSATQSFQKHLHELTQERDDLRATVKMLCKKLFAVCLFLGDMENEQQDIYDRAVSREKDMSEASEKHQKLVEEVRAQNEFFEEAKDQRALLIELLRQQEDALEKATLDRNRVVKAIEDHAKHVESSLQIRQEMVEDAGSLKHQISDILSSVKLFIPKARDDEAMVDEVVRTVLSYQGEGTDDNDDEKGTDDENVDDMMASLSARSDVSGNLDDIDIERVMQEMQMESQKSGGSGSFANFDIEKLMREMKKDKDDIGFLTEEANNSDDEDEPEEPLGVAVVETISHNEEQVFEAKSNASDVDAHNVQSKSLEDLLAESKSASPSTEEQVENNESEETEPADIEKLMEEAEQLSLEEPEQVHGTSSGVDVEALLAETRTSEADEAVEEEEDEPEQMHEEEEKKEAQPEEPEVELTTEQKVVQMVEIQIDIQPDGPQEIETPLSHMRRMMEDIQEEESAEARDEAESPKDEMEGTKPSPVVTEHEETSSWKEPLESPCEVELEKWKELMDGKADN